jgi:putative nucleotidyltransferase with HDIG domain
MDTFVRIHLPEDLQTSLSYWRDRAIKILNWIVVIVCIPFIGYAFISSPSYLREWFFIIGGILPFILAVALAFIKQINPFWRTIIILSAIYIAGVVDLLHNGITGMGRDYLLMLPLVAVVLGGIQSGVIFLFLSLFSVIIVAYLARASLLTGIMLPAAVSISAPMWNSAILFLAVSGICMLVVISVVNRLQMKTMIDQNNTANKFQQANEQLIKEIIDRQSAELKNQFQIQRLKALREVDQAISADFDIKTVSEVICQQIILHLEADAAEISLINRIGQLESLAFDGTAIDLLSRAKINENSRLVKFAMRKHRTVEMNDISQCTGIGEVHFMDGQKIHTYFAIPLIIERQSYGVLEVFHRFPVDSSKEWLNFLEMLAGQAVIAVQHDMLLGNLERSNRELSRAYDTTLEGWANTLEMRDHETRGHSQRVTALTLALAKKLGVPEALLPHIRRGALLHDVGKMAIPDSTLLKSGKLNEDEWDVMKMHPIYAYNLLRSIEFLQPALSIPRYHHEKWDGTGYPDGLKGEDIPLEARIFAVVDVWDALLCERTYKRPWGKLEALDYIRQQAGHHFDPRIVAAFEEIVVPDVNN